MGFFGVDATIISEVFALRACCGPIGQQAMVLILGTRQGRIILGALNTNSGHLELLITAYW